MLETSAVSSMISADHGRHLEFIRSGRPTCRETIGASLRHRLQTTAISARTCSVAMVVLRRILCGRNSKVLLEENEYDGVPRSPQSYPKNPFSKEHTLKDKPRPPQLRISILHKTGRPNGDGQGSTRNKTPGTADLQEGGKEECSESCHSTGASDVTAEDHRDIQMTTHGRSYMESSEFISGLQGGTGPYFQPADPRFVFAVICCMCLTVSTAIFEHKEGHMHETLATNIIDSFKPAST